MSHNSLLGLITAVIALAIVAPIAMTLFFRRMRGSNSAKDSTPPNDRDDSV